MDAPTFIAAIAFVMLTFPAAWGGVRAYRLYGGMRLISCPETAEPALVLVQFHVMRALGASLKGRPDLSVAACSRWPEKSGCAQICTAQIRSSPSGCRVRGGPAAARNCAMRPSRPGPKRFSAPRLALAGRG